MSHYSQPSQNPQQGFQTSSGQPVQGPVVRTGNGDYVVQSGQDRGKVVFPVNPPPQPRQMMV